MNMTPIFRKQVLRDVIRGIKAMPGYGYGIVVYNNRIISNQRDVTEQYIDAEIEKRLEDERRRLFL